MPETKEPGKSWESFVSRLSRVTGYASGWVIFAMMILVTAAVFARRLFGYPLVFSDEYSAYLMVFCVFVGGAYTLQQDAHVRVDIVAIRLKPRVRILFRIITSFCSLIYGAVLTWQTTKLVFYYQEIGHKASSIMETPTWIPAIAVPVGMFILTLQMVLCLAQEIRSLSKADSAQG
jgi:TRAP-type C4-dicarboxylate transport system permease small subunit